ncbi:MAG: glycosyltransferase family 4 protein [Planctomycetota bacterium]
MRITYFTNSYPAVSHTFIKRELRGLEALGHEVQRVTLRRGAGLVDEDDRREAEITESVLDLPKAALAGHCVRRLVRRPGAVLGTLVFAAGLAGRSGIGLVKMVAYLAEAMVLAELCGRFKSELVRVHFGSNGAVVARLCRRVGGPAYSVAYHGPSDFDDVGRWDIGPTIEESAFVTAISRYCESQLRRWCPPGSWDRIRIVRCAVDGRFLEPVPLPEGRPRRVCIVCRVAPPKGLPVLVDALAALRERGSSLELDIVGDGPMRAELESRVRELGLGDAVVFHGSQSGDAVRSIIEASVGMVLPSFAEGLPVVLMEAMGLGRPVITTRIVGIPELVEHGVNGWLVTPSDLEGLIGAMLELDGADAERLSVMGRAGSAAVNAMHSIDRESEALDRAIRELVETAPGARGA